MADALPVRQYVVEALRSEILALRFAPGEKLVERRLCEMTGASRTALREGLRQLEAEGLIEIIPNRGPIVPKLTPKNAQDIYQLRGVLEADLSRQAAQSATGRDVIALRAIAEKVTSAMRSGDRKALLAAKSDFYDWLLRLSDNDETTVVMRKLLGRTAIIWPSTVLDDMPANVHGIQTFTDLVDAIAAHDPDRAAHAARVQVLSAGEFALAHMQRSAEM
ncbi:transcriptional regulator, GntR family [Yoonia rosea]|uniref:Transcriptional regulator, GntR family n=1 Tax=Yoonia rosea TaxID=287098 RepID=A0A1R3WJ42_9RHOB|nr:GntR family transcriptional regulator [Yoonia rosea]SIT78181.1 transcriptional regulator, GntR family [Yoonia rosea]